jgi:pSer/pThr/pTyr-binding forkhead associated (FHA) protein
MKAFLEILSGKNVGQQYEIGVGTIHIGRTGDNDIIVDDELISRHHAHLVFEKGAFYIIDLDTSNGTLVNKKPILNQKLQNGDIIQIGSHVFRFFIAAQDQQHLTHPVTAQTPQQESIRAIDPAQQKGSSLRLIIYGGGFAALALMLVVMMQSPQQRVPSGTPEALHRSSEIETPSAQELPKLQKESYYINKEKADNLYRSGYREFMAKNYLRALDDFKAALELYPDHELAGRFLSKTEATISEKISGNHKAALNYFIRGYFHLSIYHFNQVLSLMERRSPPRGYCDLREERRVAMQNSDFEKFCDAKQKISEAQERITLP